MSEPGTIAEALVGAARSSCGIRAIEHDGRSLLLSYEALLADALHIAGALRARGVLVGDRVALIVPEVSDFVRAFFAISAAGCVPVPLCPPTQAGDLATFALQSRHILAASRASAVVTSGDVAPLLASDELPAPNVSLIDDLRGGPALAQPARVSLADPALLQFTSGSTAAPKGVVLTHANVQANVAAITGPQGLAVEPTDVGVSWLPLYHDMGLIGMLLSALYARVDTIILSPVLFLKRPTVWLETISTHRATVSFAPNFAYELCLRRVKPSQIDALDLSTWRVAGCRASRRAMVSPNIHSRWRSQGTDSPWTRSTPNGWCAARSPHRRRMGRRPWSVSSAAAARFPATRCKSSTTPGIDCPIAMWAGSSPAGRR